MKKVLVMSLMVFIALFTANAFAVETPPFTEANTYYVDGTSGDDTFTGLTMAKAVKTIGAAITKAKAVVPTGAAQGWGHQIMVKPGTFAEALVIDDAALDNLDYLVIRNTSATAAVVVQPTAGSSAITFGNAANVTIKGLTLNAIDTQSVPLVKFLVGAASECANAYFYGCTFDTNAAEISAVVYDTSAFTLVNSWVSSDRPANFENCTFDMSGFVAAAGNIAGILVPTGSNILVNGIFVKGCKFIGASAKVGSTTNGAHAFMTAGAAKVANLKFVGNQLQYADVLIESSFTGANDLDTFMIAGNYFQLTDGVIVKNTSGVIAANAQFGGGLLTIRNNHFQLNDVNSATPRDNAVALGFMGNDAMIADGKLLFTQNNIEVKNLDATNEWGGNIGVVSLVYVLGGGGYPLNCIPAADIISNWWGADAGPAVLAASSLAGRSTAFTVPGVMYTIGVDVVPAIDPAKGIEYYDVDHDGLLDKALIWFGGTAILLPGTMDVSRDGLTMAGRSVTRIAMETDLDGDGGLGTQFNGAAVYFAEGTTFDTSSLPDVTYNYLATGLAGLTGTATKRATSWQSLSAVEVDKASPVFIQADTQDTNGNGILDKIKLTFSEQIQGIRAKGGFGASLPNGIVDANVDSNIVISSAAGNLEFNLGPGSATGNIWNIPLSEMAYNTDATPTIQIAFNADYAGPDVTINAREAIRDFAKIVNQTDTPLPLWVPKLQRTIFDSGTVNPTGGASDRIDIIALDASTPIVTSVQTDDTNFNGKIDKMTVGFSEPVASTLTVFTNVKFVSSVTSFGSTGTPTGEYTATAKAISGTVVEFTITPNAVATTFDTEAVPEFRYTPSATTTLKIDDAAGNQLAAYGTGTGVVVVTRDNAKPIITKIETMDAYTDTNRTGGMAFNSTGANGRIDGIVVSFSENITTTAGTTGAVLDAAIAQFALTHVNGAVTLTKIPAASATVGAPTLVASAAADQTGLLTITFNELSHVAAGMVNGGDTGSLVTPVYTASVTTANNFKDATGNLIYATVIPTCLDKAAPFVVQGIGRNWTTNAFSNVKTVDSNGEILLNDLADTGNGDGFIDAFEVKLTEAVTIPAAADEDSVASFTTTLTAGGTLTFGNATNAITGSGTSTITVAGTADRTGSPNTGTTPALSFDGKLQIHDNTAALLSNNLAAFTLKPSSDGAAPVMVGLLQNAAIANQVKVTWSEPVYLHYASTVINAPVDSVNTASNSLFSYEDTNAGNATATSATYIKSVTGLKGDNQWIVGLDANLVAADISSSAFWVKGAGIKDDVDAVETALVDNEAVYIVLGTNIKIRIMDDVVAPYITSITTVDADGNGYIDHLKFTLQEAVSDTTMDQYVSRNAMSGNVFATYVISGYTGESHFNFFTGSGATADKDAGKEAAAAAGKPVFDDNGMNDNILYLEIDEVGLTKYAVTSLGTTGYTGTLSFGIVLPTLTDVSNRSNRLDTTFGLVVAAQKGKIVDKVGPRLMKAEWANSKIRLSFSEAVADTGSVYQCYDFMLQDMNKFTATFVEATGSAPSSWTLLNTATAPAFCRKLTAKSWVNSGVLELSVDPTIFPSDARMGIQIASHVPPSGVDGVFKDAAVDAAGVLSANTSDKYTSSATDVSTVGYAGEVDQTAFWYTLGNKFCPYPYDQVWENDFLQLVEISGLQSLALTAPGSINTMAGQIVDITWISTNIDSVDVWTSNNLGISYAKIAKSRTVGTAGTYAWTVTSGVNYVMVSSSADSAISSVSGLITIIAGEEAIVTGKTITVLTPTGLSNVIIGSGYSISWSTKNMVATDRVDIYAQVGPGWQVIIQNLPATGVTYFWTARSGVVKLKVQLASDATVFGLSKTLRMAQPSGVVLDPPAMFTIEDVAGDNGHWMLAKFKVPGGHMTAIKSYQFYRITELWGGTAYIFTAAVPAGYVSDGFFYCYFPTPVNGTQTWGVISSNSITNSNVMRAGKEGAIPVAQLVDTSGAAKPAEDILLSEMSNAAVGEAVDNLAFSPITVYSSTDNAGSGAGIKVTWTAPVDHGIVGQYGDSGTSWVPIYGVDKYEVFRRDSSNGEFVVVGTVGAGALSFVDEGVADGSTVYEYKIRAYDGNPDHTLDTNVSWAMANVNANSSDFNSDSKVDLLDLTALASYWTKTKDQNGWISQFDLNADGEIQLADFTKFASNWGFVTGNDADATNVSGLPVSNVAFNMTASYDHESSLYYVNVTFSDVASLNGFEFGLSYDKAILEVVPESISGLVGLSIPTYKDGLVDIASIFVGEKFNGTVTFGFEAKGKSINNAVVEMTNALVSDKVLGLSTVKELSGIKLNIPTAYALSRNFPNPFNPTTTIEYAIPRSGNVELVIYNMAGQKVRTLVNEHKETGYFKVMWDGRNDRGETAGSGLYFYKLVSGNFNKIEKMTLVK